MVKHTQTVRRQQLMNCLNVCNHFVGLTVKGLISFCKTGINARSIMEYAIRNHSNLLSVALSISSFYPQARL